MDNEMILFFIGLGIMIGFIIGYFVGHFAGFSAAFGDKSKHRGKM